MDVRHPQVGAPRRHSPSIGLVDGFGIEAASDRRVGGGSGLAGACDPRAAVLGHVGSHAAIMIGKAARCAQAVNSA